MPRSKKVVNTRRNSKPVSENNLLPQIKWGESYTSLFLGIVVVVVAAILVFSFLKGRNFVNRTTSTQSTSTTVQEQAKTPNKLPNTYVVKEGDNLWSIAEKIYGSGYNWVDLSKANKLENPGLLYVGTKLIVPDVKPIIVENVSATATVMEEKTANPITGVTYTVEKGDYLWEIAIRAYGDGYKWVDIARVNNLANPDLIFSGNVLKLPR